MSELVLRVQPRTEPLIYFGGAPLGCLEDKSLSVKKDTGKI